MEQTNLPDISTLQALILLWQEREGVQARAAHAAARAARAHGAAAPTSVGPKRPAADNVNAADMRVRAHHTCAPQHALLSAE